MNLEIQTYINMNLEIQAYINMNLEIQTYKYEFRNTNI